MTEPPNPSDGDQVDRSNAVAVQRGHLRGSSLMMVGRVISMTINLVVQIFTVRYLGKSDYGIFAYALAVASLGASACLLGQDRALSRYLAMADDDEDYGRGQGVIAVAVVTVFVLGCAIAALAVGLHVFGIDLSSDSAAITTMLIMLAASPFMGLDTVFSNLFAVIAKPTAIFWRRHVVTPMLRLGSVLFIIVTAGSVEQLAAAYLVTAIIGVGLYVVFARRLFQRHPLGQRHSRSYPVGDMLRYGTPMVTSDIAQALRATIVIILLEAMHSIDEVGAFRAVLPIAQLNVVALQSFSILYLPAASRLFGRRDQRGVCDLYWQSAAWLAIGTFPIFVATFSLAGPTTQLLFGDDFASSANILAVLAFGYYFSSALGLNVLTLKASGNVRTVVAVDGITSVVALGLNIVLISQFGAMGAAVSTTCILLLQNVLVHVGLGRVIDDFRFPSSQVAVYAWVTGGASLLLAVETLIGPPPLVSFALGIVTVAVVLMANHHVLSIGEVYPEAGGLPLIGRFLVAR